MSKQQQKELQLVVGHYTAEVTLARDVYPCEGQKPDGEPYKIAFFTAQNLNEGKSYLDFRVNGVKCPEAYNDVKNLKKGAVLGIESIPVKNKSKSKQLNPDGKQYDLYETSFNVIKLTVMQKDVEGTVENMES